MTFSVGRYKIIWGSVEPGNGRRFGYSNPKGGEYMPIIVTFHPFGFTVTIRITKRDNRHSDK